jgi:hypothetical protein
VSGSITTVSSSVVTLSGSVSASIATTLSSSFAKVQQLANGGYPGTFIENDIIYSPVIGGQLGYISSLFKVGTAPSIYLDARQSPRKIFIGGAIPSGETEYSGAYNSTNTAVYLDSTGKFSLKNKLTWDGGALTIQGTLKVADGTGVASSTDLSSGLGGKISTGAAAADVNSNTTTISGGKIRTGIIESTGYAYTSGNFSTAGMQINLDNGLIRSKNFSITSAGDAFFKGDITGAGGTFSGTVNIGGTDLTTANTLNANTTAANVGLGSVQNLNAQSQAQTGLIAGTTITGGGITLSNGGNIKGGQTDFNTGTGFFLGYSSGYKFSIGNSSDNYLTWNGITLNVGGVITATSGEIGGWTIGGNKIYKANKLELDASAVYPAINVYGSDNIPRVIINNSPALSSLSGGGTGTGGYDATAKTSANTNTRYYYDTIDFPTVAGANYSLTITFTESDSAYACNFSPVQSSGQLSWRIDIYNTAVTSEIQNVYLDGSNVVANQTFWSYSDLGGINGMTVTVNVVGDGTTYKIRPSTYYNGTAAAARDLDFPSFNYNWVQSVSKTEIIPGGFQVVNNSAAYLVANRVTADSAATPWMTSAGNWKHNGTLITTSDRNIKKNITPINFDLTKLNEIDGYSYDKTIDYDGDSNGDVVISTYGIIAQEIETILPNAVTTNASDGIKGVDYNAVTGMLLSAVKKLYLKVVELENRISGSV